MRKKILFAFIFAGIACLILAHVQRIEASEPIFFADFDAGGIPNDSVNDPGNWEPENAAIIWAVADFPALLLPVLLRQFSRCASQ